MFSQLIYLLIFINLLIVIYLKVLSLNSKKIRSNNNSKKGIDSRKPRQATKKELEKFYSNGFESSKYLLSTYLPAFNGNISDIKSIYNQSFMKAITRFKGPQEKFMGFLKTVFKNDLIDCLRTQNNRLRLEKQVAEESERTVSHSGILTNLREKQSQSILREKQSQSIINAIKSMKYSKKNQKILIAFFSGASYKEISETQNIPLGSVKNLVHRFKKNILNLKEKKSNEFFELFEIN
jgi:RNA polymerase sigma factor (sigma-70 family)